MAIRTAGAEWNGALSDGEGTLSSTSGAVDGQYSFSSRFEEGVGTNPEELIAAAHAGCFSMQLSGLLGEAGYEPESVETNATVHIEEADPGFKITLIELDSRARVPGIDEDEFQRQVEAAKETCPVSQALAATEITASAELLE